MTNRFGKTTWHQEYGSLPQSVKGHIPPCAIKADAVRRDNANPQLIPSKPKFEGISCPFTPSGPKGP